MTSLVYTTTEQKMVIIIPKKPAMSVGKVASQAAHAAMVAGLKSQQQPGFVSWLLGGMKKIVLQCNHQADLSDLEIEARDIGLVTHLVFDEGHTEVEFGSATALAIGPASEILIDTITGHLSLYGKIK